MRIPILLSILLGSSLLSAHASSTLTLKNEPITQWQRYGGQVISKQAATVSAQTSGRVVDIFFDENDFVEKDQVLLNLTSTEQGARVQSASAEEARMRALSIQASNQYKRYQSLRSSGAISTQQLENAKAQAQSAKEGLAAAKAAVQAAKESLNYTKVYAPFSGRLTKRFVEVGESVAPGIKLFSGYNHDTLRVDIAIPQRVAQSMPHNPMVQVSTPTEETLSLQGELFTFSDSALKRILRIELAGLEPFQMGDWISAKLPVSTAPGLIIPDSALINRNQTTAVYLQAGDSWVLTQVRVLPYNKDWQVISGLKAGDVISTHPHDITTVGQ